MGYTRLAQPKSQETSEIAKDRKLRKRAPFVVIVEFSMAVPRPASRTGDLPLAV